MQISETKHYDCAIIGGGLAGLCLAIQLVQKGHEVVLFEQKEYPFHKVCGEYISMESWSFIESLGLNLKALNLPIINELHVTAQNGFKITSALALGGFGISRHSLDYLLANIAKEIGVLLIENCKVLDVKFGNNLYKVTATKFEVNAKLVCGSFGKLTPSFIDKSTSQQGDYIGVKYHIKYEFPNNVIALHNFKDGYCGISKIDNDSYCLCYLTTTKNLNDNNNDIKQLEKKCLMKNPYLKDIFEKAVFLFQKPLVISQIGFNVKSTYQNNILLLGDSAGAIAPLCGNGMSMAMRSSKILSVYCSKFLNGDISKNELINNYEMEWKQTFAFRIKTGFYLQKLFGKKRSTFLSLKILSRSPRLFKKIITFTHGKSF